MYRFSRLFLVSFFLVGLAGPASATTSSDPFPVHASMRPNVEFWKKIYSEYPSTKGVLHDCNNLKIIYGVVDLEPHGHGSSHINKKRVEEAKERYRSILDKLAQGEAPSTRVELSVYAMFGPNPQRDEFRKARDNMRCQVGQMDMFLAGVKRSGMYLERIKDIFRSHGLPEDLAYLPHVESSYNYEAYSKFGAAGIWQFTRSTGQRFMQVDYAVDERRDPIAASYAAAKFLKQNHDLLGSWPMALTAYNHGPNGMLRAKNEKGSYARIFDEYDGKNFKFASRNFYSEYIAAQYVAKNYRKYFGDVILDRPVLYHTIEMEGYAPVASISEFFNVGVDEIRRVNPALRPPVFDGQKNIPKGYRLRLPGQAQKMARMSSALPSSLFENNQKRSHFYRVQRGDTASKIASQHKVNVNELLGANSLGRSATIFVGQNLRIPTGGERPTMLASTTTTQASSQAEPTMAILKGKVLAKSTAQENIKSPVRDVAKWRPQGNPHGLIAAREEATPPAALVARAEKRVVERVEIPVVASAEAVFADISAVPPVVDTEASQITFGSLEAIGEPELLAAEVIAEAGEELQQENVVAGSEYAVSEGEVFAEEEAGKTGMVFADAAEVVNPLVLVGNFDVSTMKKVKGTDTGTIRVEVEETLGHYANWLEIPTQKIRSLNRYRFDRAIHYGQKLQLPFAKVSKDDFEERRYLFHKEIVEDFFVAFKVDGEKSYRVKKGDNLWTLCSEKFDLPFWLIKQYNADFDFLALRPGSEIKVPVISKIDSDNQVAEVVPGGRPGKSLVKNISTKKLAVQ